MKIKTTLTIAAIAVLLAACGKDPAPLSSLPPVKDLPKAAPEQAPANAPAPAATPEPLKPIGSPTR